MADFSPVSIAAAAAAGGSSVETLDNSAAASLTMAVATRVVHVINVQTTDATVWLPAAAQNLAGTTFYVLNIDGTCSSSKTISVVCNSGAGHPAPGSDTFNGAGGFILTAAYGVLHFESDGVSRYTRIT
jgi:hypothetical protein